MGYSSNSNTYAPAYYSSVQHSISSICKTMLPFSMKKRRLTAAEQKVSKQQSDNLKWQQNSFHKILNLIGLHREGLLPDSEVSAFRTHLLDTLIASKGPHNEQPQILRDKLLFLQELLYAKCISAEEYHASKRPLLQRLAVQGGELEARDVIVGEGKECGEEEEEWSVIDLKDKDKDDQCLINKDSCCNSRSNNRCKSAVKHMKEAASVLGFQKLGKSREQKKSIFDHQFPVDNKDKENENPFWNDNIINNETQSETKSSSSSILMPASDGGLVEKQKKTGLGGLFVSSKDKDKEKEKEKEKEWNNRKKQWDWGFDGLKRWKKTGNVEGPLTERERWSNQMNTNANANANAFYIDKVVGDNIRKELSRIQTQLSTTNPNFQFSNDEMDVISTKLPVDKCDLNQYFPKSWCERYGDVVLDVVKKEFKDHVGEMQNMRNATWERRRTTSASASASKRWTTNGSS